MHLMVKRYKTSDVEQDIASGMDNQELSAKYGIKHIKPWLRRLGLNRSSIFRTKRHNK